MSSVHILQQYINTVYELNTNIVFTAPTGSGKSHFFNENVVNNLLEEKKSCLILVSHSIIQSHIMEDIEFILKKEDIFSKNSNSFHFKNGSKIIVSTMQKESNNFSNINCDILYIDSIGNLSNRYLYKFQPLLTMKYDKLIVTDSYENENILSILNLLKYKPFYYKNIESWNDIKIELRMFKLKKLREKCCTTI